MSPNKKSKGLGRGLEALLGPKSDVSIGSEIKGLVDSKRSPTELPLDQLQAGVYQPRTRMDEGALYELAESIKAQGVMQAILVRPLSEEGRYEIIAGERRFRAARLAGLDRIPVRVCAVDDRQAAAMALIENMQREDLNPLEEAQGLQRLIREFGLTHEDAAQAVGRSRSSASNLLRLLNLTEPVQTMLMAGDIDMGHARALLTLDRATQITAANQVAAKKLSVRQTEALVKKLGAEFNLVAQPPKGREKSRDVRRVEEELSDALLSEVEIRIQKKGKGRHAQESGELIVRFGSMEALNGIIERLRRGSELA